MLFKELLIKLYACSPAVDWAEDKTIEEIVKTCHRGDWLLWLAHSLKLPLTKLVLAKARCAKTVLHLMTDERSRKAVEVAEKFGLGECTLKELNIAREESSRVRRSFANDASYAASYAGAAAEDAADDDDDARYADAASYAAAAADAAAYADANYADDAAAATNAANAAAYAANGARISNQKETANICREVLGDLIIANVNQQLQNADNS